MGTDIHLAVEVYDRGRWCNVDVPLGDADGRHHAEDRSNWPQFGVHKGAPPAPTPAPYANRGLPPDADPDSLYAFDLEEYWGFTHATLAELRATDYAAFGMTRQWPVVRWIHGPELSELAARWGPESVRVLVAFDN